MEPLPKNALEDIGEANTGDGKTLADFVVWGRQKFPARHFMLVIWGHGQGWRFFIKSLAKRQRLVARSRGFETKDSADSLRAAAVQVRNGNGVAAATGQTAPFRSAPGDAYRSASNDETNQDVLYNREIEDALKAALNGERLDIIGFDACLMAMVETSYALRDVAAYLVGSEELEPGPGWKYDDVLAAIVANPGQDAKTLGG